jgi:hypothetical protein
MKPTPNPEPDDEPLTEDLPPLTTLRPLSDTDRDLLLAALENPPPPTETLKRALAAAHRDPAPDIRDLLELFKPPSDRPPPPTLG